MAYVMAHTKLWFCWWDLLALAVLIAVIVVFVMNHRKLKQQRDELKDELSSLYTGDAVDQKANPAQGTN